MTTDTGPRAYSSPSKESRGALLDREVSVLNAAEGKAIENQAAAGMALRHIREHSLWAIRHCSYYEFLKQEAQVEPRRAAQYVALSIKWEELSNALGFCDDPMPKKVCHLVALDKVAPEHRGIAWQLVIREGVPITESLIARVIQGSMMSAYSERAATFKEEHIKSVQDARKRIGELCGDLLLRRIDNNKYRVSEKELIVWARQDDDNVVAVARGIEKLGWSVSKAIEALFKPLTPGTTMRELAALNIMRNRPVAIAFGGSSIRAEEFH